MDCSKIGKRAGRQKCSVSCSHMDGQFQGMAENVTLANCLWTANEKEPM